MNRQVGAGMIVGALLALGWVASGRLGYAVSADDPGPLQELAVSASTTSPVGQAAAIPPAGQYHAAFEWPAGTEYKLSDTGVEAYKASLAALWQWNGDVGTYGDGKTQVRIVAESGQVSGVEIIENASAISNACLEAQLLYGVSVDGAGVAAACAGVWTKEWAESQAAADSQGH